MRFIYNRNWKNRWIVIIFIISIPVIWLYLMINSRVVEQFPKVNIGSTVLKSEYVKIYEYENSFMGRFIHRIENFIDSVSNNYIVDRNITGKQIDPSAIDNSFIKGLSIDLVSNPEFTEWDINKTSGRYGTYVKSADEFCLLSDCIYNESSPNIWARQKVMVKILQKNIKRGDISEKHGRISSKLKKQSGALYNETHFELLLTPPIIMIWAYELGYALSEVFERHGVGYILQGGSALGAARHKGIIPWDDDFDISIHGDYESLLINEVAADLFVNYSITWQPDEGGGNYKFYHAINSIIVPALKNQDNPWRYPFADIFIFKEHPRYHILTYSNKWRDIEFFGKYPGQLGFNPSIKWPNGTELVDFGEYKMRITKDNEKFLSEHISPNWYEVGVTSWWNHYKNSKMEVVEFEMSPMLYQLKVKNEISTNYIKFYFGKFSLVYDV